MKEKHKTKENNIHTTHTCNFYVFYLFIYFIYLKLSVHICKTVASRRIIVGTSTPAYTRVTRQGRMALTGVDAQNIIKC